jgi:hypothetical protein
MLDLSRSEYRSLRRAGVHELVQAARSSSCEHATFDPAAGPGAAATTAASAIGAMVAASPSGAGGRSEVHVLGEQESSPGGDETAKDAGLAFPGPDDGGGVSPLLAVLLAILSVMLLAAFAGQFRRG